MYLLVMADDDVQGGIARFRPGVLELISKVVKLNGGVSNFLRRDDLLLTKGGDETSRATTATTTKDKPRIVPIVEANESFLL
jgi:hypothetical protein